MLRIGLTGGIGSGKSTVAERFARHGVPVIDTDALAHALVESGLPAHAAVVEAFGAEITGPGGKIDRARLRARVFASAEERRRLEAILHPRIRAAVTERLAALQAPYCLIVVPLLFEAGFTDLVDRVLVVDVEEELQCARTTARGLAAEEVRAIMAAQLPRRERLQRADDVIANSGALAELDAQVARLHAHYLTLAAEDDQKTI